MTAVLYRAKPIVVEAIQWTGRNRVDVLAFARSATGAPSFIARESGDGWFAEVWTGHDWTPCPVGSYIVRDTDHTFRVVSGPFFESHYEGMLP